MPLPVITDTFRCTILSEVTGSDNYAANVIHVRSDTLNEEQVASALATLVANGDSPWTNLMCTTAFTSTLVVVPLDGSSAGTEVVITGGTGIVTGDPLVASCGLVSLKTPLRGPRNRGRIYVPFLGEGGQSNGVLNSSVRTSTSNAFDDWLGELDTAGMELVVASYVEGQAHTVTSGVVSSSLATQRRRQDRIRREL